MLSELALSIALELVQAHRVVQPSAHRAAVAVEFGVEERRWLRPAPAERGALDVVEAERGVPARDEQVLAAPVETHSAHTVKRRRQPHLVLVALRHLNKRPARRYLKGPEGWQLFVCANGLSSAPWLSLSHRSALQVECVARWRSSVSVCAEMIYDAPTTPSPGASPPYPPSSGHSVLGGGRFMSAGVASGGVGQSMVGGDAQLKGLIQQKEAELHSINEYRLSTLESLLSQKTTEMHSQAKQTSGKHTWPEKEWQNVAKRGNQWPALLSPIPSHASHSHVRTVHLITTCRFE